MRIVYDDKKQKTLIKAVDDFIRTLSIKCFTEYEWGMERVKMEKIKQELNNFLKINYNMEIGNKVTHLYGIGNNCCYPVYYHPKNKNEIQHCANININSGMYGEGFINIEDYNGCKVSKIYELNENGIKIIEDK